MAVAAIMLRAAPSMMYARMTATAAGLPGVCRAKGIALGIIAAAAETAVLTLIARNICVAVIEILALRGALSSTISVNSTTVLRYRALLSSTLR